MKVFQYFEQKFSAQIGTLDQREMNTELETLRRQQEELETECLNKSTVVKTNLGTVYHPLSQTGRANYSCRLWTVSDVFISKSLAAKQDPNFSQDSVKLLQSKNIKYNTINNILKLFEGIRSDYLKRTNTGLRGAGN